MATSSSLFSQSSAFGPLSELSSRRTFAYLIATLNASHPHYDFSNVLRPADFKRERSLRRLMANLDSILQNVRGNDEDGMAEGPAGSTTSTSWSQHCWSLIDKEMRLDECTIFNYRPDVDPFEDEESAIWSVHYFFFNRALKRVAYVYLRVVPVISSQSPRLGGAAALASGGIAGGIGGGAAIGLGATKRARYWLSARDAAVAEAYDDDDEEDGFLWNRDEDGDLLQFSEDEYADEQEEDDFGDDAMEIDDGFRHVRGVSEDIASRMEI